MSESTLRKYLIRDVMGTKLHEVEGTPVQLALLPEWEFFIRAQGGFWILTEVRSGAKFPGSSAPTMDEAIREFELFANRRGREECQKVFNEVISKFGDVTRAN